MMKHVEIRIAIKALIKATDTNYANMDEVFMRAKKALQDEGLRRKEYDRMLRLVTSFVDKCKHLYNEPTDPGDGRRLAGRPKPVPPKEKK